MSDERPLPSNPMPSNRSPSPRKDGGFSRTGFAPIPHRHQDIPPPPMPPRDEWDRRGDLPPPPVRRDDLDRDRRIERDEWDRRRPDVPPRWEEDYDRPKRRRSPSPSHPSHRPRLRSPSPPRHGHSMHGLPDPAEVEYQLSFKQFAEWFRASHPQTARADDEEFRRAKEGEGLGREKVGMSKRYERYKKEYLSRQLYALFLTHRDSPWFLERYSQDAVYVEQRRRVNRQGRVPTAERYLDALKAGQYDDVSFDLTESEEKGKSARRMSHNDEPEGLDRALGDAGNDVEDPLRVEVAPTDRQIFVKTVPPSTSRKELEELFERVDGFEYLALTEPFPKKAFHRVAWAQFGEGVDPEEVVRKVDGSKIDTFTFHMGVNASPVVGRVKVNAPASNTLERLLIDGEKAHDLAYKLEEELLDDEEVKGEGQQYPGLREKGTTVVQSRIDRLLEDQGLVGDDLPAELRLKRAKIIADQWISYLRHGLSTCYYCVAAMAFPEELYRKCVSHKRPVPIQDEVSKVEEDEVKTEDVKAEPADTQGRDDADGEDDDRRQQEDEKPELPREKRQNRPDRAGDDRWEEMLDTKLRPLLQQVDVAEYGGRDPDEEARKLAAPIIKQEEASKYRCKECNKLFKAPEFVIKHITVKHPNLLDLKTDELAMLNAFVLDPQRLQPTAQTPAAVNDRLPAPPPMPFGQQAMFNPAFAPNGAGGGGGMNMMQQQMMMMMQMQQAMMMNMAGQGNGRPGAGPGTGLAQRMGGFADAPPPEPLPAAGPVDPRAKKGRVSYMDLDEPGGAGDGGLPY